MGVRRHKKKGETEVLGAVLLLERPEGRLANLGAAVRTPDRGAKHTGNILPSPVSSFPTGNVTKYCSYILLSRFHPQLKFAQLLRPPGVVRLCSPEAVLTTEFP